MTSRASRWLSGKALTSEPQHIREPARRSPQGTSPWHVQPGSLFHTQHHTHSPTDHHPYFQSRVYGPERLCEPPTYTAGRDGTDSQLHLPPRLRLRLEQSPCLEERPRLTLTSIRTAQRIMEVPTGSGRSVGPHDSLPRVFHGISHTEPETMKSLHLPLRPLLPSPNHGFADPQGWVGLGGGECLGCH